MTVSKMLRGKVALVTGAGRGVGAEIAKMMALRGAKVIVNDLGGTSEGEGKDQTPALKTVRAIRDAGGEAEANFSSVADFDAAQDMVDQAIESFGRIDIVINNAGILRDCIFHKMTQADWDLVIDVHLKGSFNTSRAAAPYFRQQEAGVFVHMTSTSGLIGNFGQANYMAAKLGIVGLSKSLALDMSRFGVRSNCISPFAWSRMIGTIPINDGLQKKRVEKLKQMTPDKVAAVAVALCGDGAVDVTGQIFAVRNNEIFLMGQHRPLRGLHDSMGWSPESVIERAFPAMMSNFYPLDRSQDIFSWDPV
ncbi:MAG: 3-hydroxyacyl-CoA dehydrogenase [Rhodospirillaceae bacterium TMED8]|nr:3-hydroxyacyl-CoA dehydrogenase [Magnetovibrio sp.]OUT48313.1 MAG: 3-hydroxyacyl-CoA dehydrogenase [Rhodospirillaceae bacterium TMED8]